MTGKFYNPEIEKEMTDIVRKAVSDAGSVRILSKRMQLDEDIIDDIRTGRGYPMTPATFESRFGRTLKSLAALATSDITVKPSNAAAKTEERIVPVEIRCPGYNDMVKLIERTGRKVKIVYA